MGADAMKTYCIGIALAAIVVFYFSPNIFDNVIPYFPIVGVSEATVKNFLTQYHPNYNKEEKKNGEKKAKVRLFTTEELSKYDGGADSKGLYLAILGDVFDVSKGAQHYKPGSSYAFFAGRDASRAYITGDFKSEENADDVSDLDDASVVGLNDWISFYREEYKFMGVVIGKYYDKSGNPTPMLKQVQEKMKKEQSNKWVEDNEKNIFPSCNSEWSKEKGSKVWCTKLSGGVERDWVGVPRQLYKTGKDPRCVCVRDSGPPSNSPQDEKHSNVGDLGHPNLQEYQDCLPEAESCQVAHP